MEHNDTTLHELSSGSESWLRGKIDDGEVDKTVGLVKSMGTANAVAADDSTTSVTGTVICAIFYWRITLDTPDGHHFVGNAGGLGSMGGGGLQGGYLKGVPDLPTLYAKAVSFQFNCAAVGLNVNFFDKDSNLVGTYVGGGLGICLGTGGGSGSWSS